MKNIIKTRHVIYSFLIITGTAFLSGCTVYSHYTQAPVSVPEIVQMSKDGVSSKDIISDIRKSHTVYTLKADQLAKLQNEGVSDSVINYMEKTHIQSIRQDQRYQDYGYYGPGWGGSWYGSPYFGGYSGYWGWNWGPSVIFEDRMYHGGGGGHGFHNFHSRGRHN